MRFRREKRREPWRDGGSDAEMCGRAGLDCDDARTGPLDR